MINLLLTSTQTNGNGSGGLFGGGSGWMMIVYVVVFIAIIYFLMIRPTQKQQKRQAAMLQSLEVGDYVLTTGGFYGEIIDVTEDDIIVEFGNNKNCRIPMKKEAVAEIQKKDSAKTE